MHFELFTRWRCTATLMKIHNSVKEKQWLADLNFRLTHDLDGCQLQERSQMARLDLNFDLGTKKPG